MATLTQLAFAFGTVAITVALHLVGLILIMRIIGRGTARGQPVLAQMALPGLVVCCLFALHMVEIGVYALIYWLVGAVTPFDVALYFSAITFTTIGYGDVTVVGPWRLFAALEGLTGITLAGWSVAFLVTVVRQFHQSRRRHSDRP